MATCPRMVIALVWLLLAAAATASADVRHLRWADLLPAHLADTPIRPPQIDHDGPPALEQFSPWGDLPLEDILVPELDGRNVRLAGYVVPLGMNAAQRIDEFLLVPYFGACIHVPPPPPNQVVYVRSSEGLDPARMHMAWIVEGAMQVATRRSALADAGYTIEARTIRLFGR